MDLVSSDQNYCLRMLPPELRYFLEHSRHRPMIAGGFIRSVVTGEPISDIDIWAPSAEAAKEMVQLFSSPTVAMRPVKVVDTPNAVTVLGFQWPIQFIHKWTFESPEKLLDHFDFTIARAVLACEAGKWKGICDQSFYADLAARRLVYCESTPYDGVGGSLLRLLKFYRKGYRAPLDTVAQIVERLSALAIDKKVDVLSLLMEIDPTVNPQDVAYFAQ